MLTTIVGKKRRGKTTFIKHLILTGEFNQVYILDPQAEFLALATPPDDEEGNPLPRDESLLAKELPAIRELILRTKKYIFVHVYKTEPDLEAFFNYVWGLPPTPKLVIFDEVKTYGKTNPFIDYLYRLGGHKEIELLAIAHRFVDLPMETQAQTDEWILFQLTGRRDVQYLRDIIPDGDNAEAIVQRVKSLDFFQYIKIEV